MVSRSARSARCSIFPLRRSRPACSAPARNSATLSRPPGTTGVGHEQEVAMSAAEKMSRRDEMETLLPFYLNGSLEGAELEAVEEWLSSDPVAMAALGEAEAEFSGTAAANEAIRPPADALSRFAKALDAEAGPVRAPAGQSWLAKVFGRVTAMPAGVAWAAAAALLGLVVVQFLKQPGGKGNDFEVAGQLDDLAKLPFVLVRFKPDAKMSDIAAFLDQNG